MPVPLMDIRGQYADLLDEVKRSVCEVIDSGRFILGPNMRALEEEIAAATGAGHAVAVGNGTDALVLSLEALGIGAGDEVITTAYTFYATAEAIARVGAAPVFADIDPVTFNLDPRAAEAAVTERTRAIVAVHLYGGPADMPGLREVAGRHGLALIEDAAQAFGAAVNRRGAGSLGDLATFSFFPTKNFPAFGDAGMVVSGSADLAERVRLLRFHGSREKRRFELVGTNSRMDEIQAAVLRRFLPEVAGWNAGRRAAADRYRALGLGDLVELPSEAPGARHVYHLYVVRAAARNDLARALSEAGIGCRAYYDVPLHLQPVFAHLGYRRGDLPETERASDEGLALPMFPTLDEAAQTEVVAAVRAAALAAA
ncbi:MAG TPA: DegT/DnrJ/EryC1/StrS family aminotransferase [Gaiellales bacterium]|jgi:dTDP-4-amino-4,6-dideoxygalactose transaminase|nr:DegT/DnrJ/EryC1/StrS family aminotransferase [Gaiellales bacterium]